MVYHGPGSSYGARVLHITSSVIATVSVNDISIRQTTRSVRGEFLTWRERAASSQTLQLKRPILSVVTACDIGSA